MGLFAPSTLAQLKLDTSLSGVAEYDSNVFRLPSGAPAPGTTVISIPADQRSDRILMAVATANLEYKVGDQRLYLLGDGTHYWYRTYSALNRNEGNGEGGLQWRASDELDGKLSYQQSRRMVPEEARAIPSLDLAYTTNRTASAGINFNVAPQWRLETRGDWIRQDSPAPTVQYKLDEHDYTLGTKYLGLGAIAMGFEVQGIDGSFTAPFIPVGTIPTLPLTLTTSHYRQYSEDLTVDYTVNGLSKLTAKVGSSQRRTRDNSAADSNGFTGELKYKRTISALTSVTLGLFRRLQSYPSFNDYVVETGGSGQLEYHPTPKLYSSLLLQYVNDQFHGADRSDRLALLDAGVGYELFDHFSIKPGVHLENRRSSGGTYSFIDRIYSVEAKLTF